MPVAFESSGGTVFAASNSNAAITVPLPGTRPVGSVLLFVGFCRSITATVTTAPPYTSLGIWTSGTASGGRIWVYAVDVVGGETAPTFATNGATGTSGDLWGACIFCYSGVDLSGGIAAILDGTPTTTDAAGTTTCTYPALTISRADSMIVRTLARWRDAVDTFTPTATWNERADAGSTTRTGGQQHLQDKLATASGAQASVTVAPSNTTSSRYLALTLALKAAAASMSAPFIAATGSAFTHSVSAAGFSVPIAAPFVAVSGSALVPALNPTGAVNIPAPFVAASGGAFTAALNPAGAASLGAIPFIAATGGALVPALNVAGSAPVSAPFIAATGSAFVPALLPEIPVPFIAATGGAFDPALSPSGSVPTAAPFIAATGGVFAVSLTPSGAVEIAAPFVAATGGALAATMTVAGAAPIPAPFIADGTVLYGPVITSMGTIATPFIPASDTVLPPVLAPAGSVDIPVPYVAETGSAFAPALGAGGSAPLPAPYIGSVEAVFAPTLQGAAPPPPWQPSLAGARIADSATSAAVLVASDTRPTMGERASGPVVTDSSGRVAMSDREG